MSCAAPKPTVLVVGIGEVGRYLLEFLAREDPEIRIVAADIHEGLRRGNLMALLSHEPPASASSWHGNRSPSSRLWNAVTGADPQPEPAASPPPTETVRWTNEDWSESSSWMLTATLESPRRISNWVS